MREQFARALPKHLSPERFCRIAITALTRTPKLAECTQESLMKCLLDLSAFGLEPDGRRAHLIPYKDQCTLVIDWKGLAELAMRSGVIAKLHADIVCENDIFEFNLGEITCHKIDFRKPRGDMYAVYALAQTKTGEVFVSVLSKDEVDGVMKRSQGYKSAIQYNKTHPWLTDYAEMAKKTAFRRLSKWLPLSAEFRDAQELEDDTEVVRDVTPNATESKLFKDIKDIPNPPVYKSLATSPVTDSAPEHPDVCKQVNAESESFSLGGDDSPSEILRGRLSAAGVTWPDVYGVLADQGLADSEYVVMSDAPSDVISAAPAQFDKIVEILKGGK